MNRDRYRGWAVALTCVAAASAGGCGSGADAATAADILPGVPGCEDPEVVDLPADAPAALPTAFADAVAATGVDVSTVDTARTWSTDGNCPDLMTVTVSGTGPDGTAAEVQLSAWWAGDALRDVTCSSPGCESLVQGPFTVFRIDGASRSSVIYQPDEAVAAGAGPGDGTDCAAADLEIDDEAFPGDTMPEEGPRGMAVYKNADDCLGAASGQYGAWAVRSTGSGPSGDQLVQLAAVEYWTDLLPPQ